MSSSKHRKEHSGFDLQPETVSTNGKKPSSSVDGPEQVVSAADGLGVEHGDSSGKIEVSPRAIAHLASRTAQRSYGVVGLAPRQSRPGWVELLRREEAHRGVEVSFPEGRVLIELYVVIEYGTRISE